MVNGSSERLQLLRVPLLSKITANPTPYFITARASNLVMNKRSFSSSTFACAVLLAAAFLGFSPTKATAEASAKELASALSATRQDGHSYIRFRLVVKGGDTLQLAIKSRREASATDVLYQVLWPKERKNEAVWLHQDANGTFSGSVITTDKKVTALSAADAKQPAFGSDLSYEDLVDNFYAWGSQTVVGEDTIGGVKCVVLESKPGGVKSTYSSVKSWVDTKRMVPLRVEKYSGGSLVRRINTTDVVQDDGKHIASSLAAERPGQGGGTDLEGSKISRSVKYSDSDFRGGGSAN